MHPLTNIALAEDRRRRELLRSQRVRPAARRTARGRLRLAVARAPWPAARLRAGDS
jgi:hypothetical protein